MNYVIGPITKVADVKFNHHRWFQPFSSEIDSKREFQVGSMLRMSASVNYQALFEGVPIAVVVLSPEADFRVLTASNAYERLSGRNAAAMAGHPLFELFPDDPNDAVADGERNLRASLERVLHTGKPDAIPLQQYSVRGDAGDFHERFWSVLNSAVMGSDGKIAYLLHSVEEATELLVPQGVDNVSGRGEQPLSAGELQTKLFARARDVMALNTSLRATNQALAVCDARFRQLTETGTFGLMIADLNGGVSYCNPALRSLLGYSEEDVASGAVCWDRMTPAIFAEDDARAVRELRERGTCTPFEKIYRAKDGRLVPVFIGASMLVPAEGLEATEVVAFVIDLSERVRVEQLLRTSELRNRTIIESLPQLVWTCRNDGYCSYLSPQWVAYTGIPEEQQLGWAWLDVVMHPDDRERTYQAWMTAVSGRADYDLEYRLRRHDGVYRWFKTRGTPVFDGAGHISEWFGTCTDIDDQIRSEEVLMGAIEERDRLWREFDTARSNSPDLTYSFDLLGRFTYANRALLMLLQRSFAEVVGRNFYELDYPPELARTLHEQIDTVIRTRMPLRAETPFTDPSGAARYYEYIFVPILAGEMVEAVTGSTRDITDRKEAEEKLREAEQRFRFALQAGRMNSWEYGPAIYERHVGAWEKGGAGLVEAWNSQTLRRILNPAEAGRLEHLFDDALRHGKEVETEIRVSREGREDAWLWVRGTFNPDTETQPRLSGLISEITERKTMEDRFRETARLESVGVLAGGIAHDFNNLLTGILGNSSLAMDDVGEDHPIYPLLESVVKGSERAATLTAQMLAYSGRGKFVVRRVDLSSLIREVSTLIKASIPRHVRLKLELQESLPAIEADVTQMHQVIMNLIVNAAEAVPAARQGQVTVRTSECTLTKGQLAGLRNAFEAPPGRYVCLVVEDDGTGMDESTQKKMFDPFFTTKFTGRGLGLSAVLGILRGHKGAVKIDSQPGHGTTVSVYLPAANGQPEKPVVQAPTVGAVGSGTILVIDDEEVVRSVAQNMLKHAGFEVLAARDGAEGVQLFRQRHREIRAILLDLSMPVLDGESALPLLRQIDPDMPIILSTGYSEVEATARFASHRLAGILQKPYTTAQLKEAVRQALDKK